MMTSNDSDVDGLQCCGVPNDVTIIRSTVISRHCDDDDDACGDDHDDGENG